MKKAQKKGALDSDDDDDDFAFTRTTQPIKKAPV